MKLLKQFHLFFLLITSIPSASAMTDAKQVLLPYVYQDHLKLRHFMQGDEKRYCQAFKHAVEQKNDVLQIALVNAYHASQQNNDSGKEVKDLKYVTMCRKDMFDLYNVLHVKAYGYNADIQRIDLVYQNAANQGFVPAALQLFFPGRLLYFEAIKKLLKDFADTGYPEAMLEYGRVLFLEGNDNQKLLGLRYMHASGFLQFAYPEPRDNISDTDGIECFLKRHTKDKGDRLSFFKGLAFVSAKNLFLVLRHGDFEKVAGIQKSNSSMPLRSKL